MRIHDAEDPRISVLKDKLEAARQEALSLLLKRNYLLGVRRAEILAEYEKYFGELESELDYKSKINWALDRESEIIAATTRDGAFLDREEIESLRESLKEESESWNGANLFSFDRDLLSRGSFAAPTEAKPAGESSEAGETAIVPVVNEICEEYELQQNYRALVKTLHPDACGETELFRKYWQPVQNAYKNRDAKALRLYSETLVLPERKFANKRDEEISLQTQLQQLQCDIARERERLENLRFAKPFCFEGRMADAAWRSRYARSLSDRLFFLDRQILIKRRHIGNMLEFWRGRRRAISFSAM